MIIEIASLLAILAAATSYNIFIVSTAKEITGTPSIVSVNEYIISILFDVAVCAVLAFAITQICVGSSSLFASSIRGFLCNVFLIAAAALAAVWGWAFSSGNGVVSLGIAVGVCVASLASYVTSVGSKLPADRQHLRDLSPRGGFMIKHFVCTGLIGVFWAWSMFALQLALMTWLQTTEPPNCNISVVIAVVPPTLVACICVLTGDFLSLLIPCAMVATQYAEPRPAALTCSGPAETAYLACLIILGFELLATIASMFTRATKKEGSKSLKAKKAEISGKLGEGMGIELNGSGAQGSGLNSTIRLGGVGIDKTIKLPNADAPDVFGRINNNGTGDFAGAEGGNGEEDEYEYEYEWEEEYEEEGGAGGADSVTPADIRQEVARNDNGADESDRETAKHQDTAFRISPSLPCAKADNDVN